MEVHFEVDAVTADVIQQGTQLVDGHPACHDALAASQYLLIQVIPLGTATLRFTHTGCPLDGIQFVDFQQGIQVVHGTYAVQVVERIVYLLALFTNERLYETAVVLLANHGRDVAL